MHCNPVTGTTNLKNLISIAVVPHFYVLCNSPSQYPKIRHGASFHLFLSGCIDKKQSNRMWLKANKRDGFIQHLPIG